MTYEALPWLVFPPAVDLANTVIASPAGERDLLETDDHLAGWIGAERGRIPGVEAASGRLAEIRGLRDIVSELLHCRARGKQPPAGARRQVNAISASVPVRTMLTADGRAVEEPDARDSYALFEATVARSAIELSDRGEDRLAACGAPSCGMLYLREHPRQV
jgi:predicted RNA-binding Zn ribbon-like protein